MCFGDERTCGRMNGRDVGLGGENNGRVCAGGVGCGWRGVWDVEGG